MNYPYENLSPEKFQEFVQALLVKEYQDFQCFPVGQPDGGRDALSYYWGHNGKKKFLVFQVKFTRQPTKIEDPDIWVREILGGEKHKIERLLQNGAEKYILVTNISGTSHLDSGSMDKVNKIVSEYISVPFLCLWRDDLNRRLDDGWDLKWSYPELMTGPDLIRSVFEMGIHADSERRKDIVKAFLADQYSIDTEVKFKQVELQNKLVDLFIDVPIAAPSPGLYRKGNGGRVPLRLFALSSRHTAVQAETAQGYELNLDTEDIPPMGAAAFLTNEKGQRYFPKVILEGAPGQGKSTISQFVCQIHRMHLLGKTEELAVLPNVYRNVPSRLPIKIDLRDFAVWLGKKNPFEADEDTLPIKWAKSLESFIAALFRHHSGGVDFEVSDLHAIARFTSLLIVFDGLDEIADIGRRQEVIEEIGKGTNRLEEVALSIQVVVTSRPAVFSNSTGLSEDDFVYLHLDSVTKQLTEEYAEKWLKARRLLGREGAEVRRILKEKLDLPHLRDLARNPMQLAILLSLIHTRGASLPDKRTSLYDNYMELFFNREAEKSEVVREHRELLINIHRYLAWVLHVEAEQGNNNGSIDEDRLHSLLEDYLEREGHKRELSKQLFRGMVERVVALVSRVQGTYEFEVQPLREYFAARFLYETAPYSPPGNEKRGTKPDRFDALARNFFWFNIARFYAGCYSKGELPSLITGLKDLLVDPDFRYILHPRTLALTLLSDWVFSQHPRSVKEVINMTVDGIGLRNLLATDLRKSYTSAPVLPKGCGNEELISHCFEILRSFPPRDYAFEVTELIKANAIPSEIDTEWQNCVLSSSPEKVSSWIEIGVNLGCVGRVDLTILEKLFPTAPNNSTILRSLLRARRFDFLESTEEIYLATIQGILDRELAAPATRKVISLLERFALSVDVYRYGLALQEPQPIPLKSLCQRVRNRGEFDAEAAKVNPVYGVAEACLEIVSKSDQAILATAKQWATELSHWDELVEHIRSSWGDNWVCYTLANIASGIKSQSVTCKEFPDIHDVSKSLCKRFRYARLRAGSLAWWEKQISAASCDNELGVALGVLMTWASSNTIKSHLKLISEKFEKMEYSTWKRTYRMVEDALGAVRQKAHKSCVVSPTDDLEDTSPRALTIIALRSDIGSKRTIFSKYLLNYNGDDEIILGFCQEMAVDALATSAGIPKESLLACVSETYKKGVLSGRFTLHRLQRGTGVKELNLDLVKSILGEPVAYPSYLVSIAEAIYKQHVARRTVNVGKIAQKDLWFD